MFCAYNRPRYQVSVYRTIGPLVKVCLSTGGVFFHFAMKTTIQIIPVIMERSNYRVSQKK